MSETRWTPGSWRVAKAHEMRGVNVIAGKDDFVCEVGFPAPHNPVEADAHLIAAAPDLYEALQEALDDWDDSHFDEEYPCKIEWADKARAALAKARGER